MRVKKYRRTLIIIFFVNLVALCFLVYFGIKNKLPGEIKILVGQEENFNFGLPLNGEFEEDNLSVSQGTKSNIPAGALSIDFNRPFSLFSSKTGSYTVDLKLFGLIHLQKLSVNVIESMEVIPSGMPIGITVDTNGILVLGTGKVTAENGESVEPAIGIVKSGDYILKVNGKQIESKEKMIEEIQNSKGKPVDLLIRRDGSELTKSVTPVKTSVDDYKVGIWIRDDTQGIGTLTFMTSTGGFGALGHGITDVDTGVLIEVGKGAIYTAEVVSITKGVEGTPGELSGIIHQMDQQKLGDIIVNTNQGIFGKLSGYMEDVCKKIGMKNTDAVPIGLRQDIKIGPAQVICAVEGELKSYDITIDQIDMSNKNHSKGLVISITDERLISVTGGIVQGMSGSPIIQDGKLVGAVTHVFIRDAKSGYGTFIENMLQRLE